MLYIIYIDVPVVGSTCTCSAKDLSLVTLQEESEEAVVNTIQSVFPRLYSTMEERHYSALPNWMDYICHLLK